MKRKILFFVFLSFVIGKAYSQDFVSKAIRGERGISRQFASFEDDPEIKFNAAQLKSLLALNQNSDLVLKKAEQDDVGFIHYRYYQTYRSIPIENAMYIIHTKNGVLKSVSGTIVTDFDPRMDQRAAQRMSGEQAITTAVSHVNAKQYAWQDAGMEQLVKSQSKDLKASYKPTASLVWYSTGDIINPRELRLCYKVDVYATQPLSRAYYFVDALTGNVIGRKERILPSDAVGTANTAYSGAVTIHSDYTGVNYRLRDYTKGSGVITLHSGSGADYYSASPNWTLPGLDIAALDAHYGVSQTYAYYWNNFGRNSYDGAGTALYSYVNAGCCDNAYWNGSYMTFLQFSGGNGGVTGIDVCGHEVTHGVTQESSGLVYQDQPGAMNESMSDIFGKAIQFWSKPADIDWRLSNDMGWFIRDMSNPNAYGQPDTYLGYLWYTGTGDHGGVHYNSGVGNFMFYLLVNGGSGTNDNGDPYSVSGIGLDAAERILYRTNTVYLSPYSQYPDWRNACISAATDIYGANSPKVTQVQNAWFAVGIGASSGCFPPTGLKVPTVGSTSAIATWTPPVTGGDKYTFRYQEATAAPNDWVTVNGLTSPSYYVTGLTPNTVYNVKVRTVCYGGKRSAYTGKKSFQTLASGGYCVIKGTTGYEYIKRVQIGSIDNTSGNDNGYGDYSSLVTNLAAGSSVQILFKPGFVSGVWHEYWEAYIDYNHDGDFDDAGERVAKANSDGTLAKTFTVPLTAINGKTRLRVVMHFNSYLGLKCGDYYDGEAEDYSVKITGGAFNAVASQSDVQATLNSIVVSPNPVKGSSASVVLQAAKPGSVNIKIADLSGRILRSETINSIIAGKNNYSLRNINLLPGTYMIIAQQGNSVIARTQFVVDK